MTATLTRPVLPTTLVEGLDDPETDGAVKTKEILIICESGDLERTWATTILATSAAASNVNVSIFFTPELDVKGQHVILVDQHTNFPTSDLADGTHPTQAGYVLMANVWWAAIGSLLR